MKSPIEYKLTEKQAKHIREVQEQIQSAETMAWALEGQAAHNRRNADTMRRHLQCLLKEFLDLPNADKEYVLSPDGKLISEITLPEQKINGVANAS